MAQLLDAVVDRDAKIAERDREIARLKARVSELETKTGIADRDAEIAKLRTRVRELETQAGQNSTNSHKPPSSDPPGTRPPKRGTGKQRGAQPGHKPNKREFLPPEKVTRRTELKPKRCACCGSRDLTLAAVDPRRHQVIDVPEIQPDVHEIVMHAASCGGCGKTTWAQLPDNVPRHMFGPRLLGLIGYLLAGRTSRRQLQELLAEVFSIPVSLGALSEAEARISNAIAEPVDEAGAHVRAQTVKHVDGSTWRLEGAHAAVWTIATKLVAVFFVTADSRTETIRSLLGTLSGTLVSDRGTQFGMWAMDRRQICWAHLIRKFAAFSERTDEGAKIGDSLLLVAQAMISEWHRVRDGTVSIAEYRTKAENAQHVIETLLKRGVALRLRGLSGACADVLAHKEALFRFAYEAGVEPTNNHAERALRPFVLWRKTSYGSQSERGCLFAQRIMTVAHSLRLQKRSVFAFLVEACHASIHRGSTPTLLPSTR